MRDLAARDRQDETRDEAPLTVPPGAMVIDTTDLTVDQVVARCLAEIRGVRHERRNGSGQKGPLPQVNLIK